MLREDTMKKTATRYPDAPFQAALLDARTRQGSLNVTLTQVGTFGFGTQPHWFVEAFDAALPAKHPSAVRREFPWSAKGEAAARAEYARHVDALVKKAA